MRGWRLVPMLTVVGCFSYQCRLSLGYPSGAGACPGGIAAVSGLHRNAISVSEQTMVGSFAVTAGRTPLEAGRVVDLPIGETLQLVVQSLRNPFKGLLIRLEAPTGVNTDMVIDSGTNTDDATTCVTPVVGITHNINSVKMKASGVVRFDAPVSGVHLDITVVQENSGVSSVFFYSRYTVNFRGSAPVPSPTSPSKAIPPSWVPGNRPAQLHGSSPHVMEKTKRKKDKGNRIGKKKDKRGRKSDKRRKRPDRGSRNGLGSRGINLPGLFRKGAV